MAVILTLLTVIVLSILFGPKLDEGEGAVLIVMVPSLIGALLALFATQAIINRD